MSDIKQSDNAEKLYDMLIDKSKESFMMAIEVYNKPTSQLPRPAANA